MIGIIGAMSVEVDSIKKILENAVCEYVGGIEFVRGILEGKEVVVAKCGIGKVFAAMCAQTMILRYNPEVIINTGVAGSLSRELSVCNAAVGINAVQYDIDTSPLGDPVGMLSGPNIIHIPCSEKASALIEKCVREQGVKVLCGTIGTADKFMSDREEKQRVSRNFGAIACDMESGAIAQVCFVNSVEFGVLRAISDSADGDSATDYNEFLSSAAELAVEVTKKFVSYWQ